MAVPRCHHRASPIECRSPGSPTCLGRVTESCLAVQSGSFGTGSWKRNHSLPGVLCRVQYSRGWSARTWIPDRMMKTSSSKFRKCSTSTHTGSPCWVRAAAEGMVPGYRVMNLSTEGICRSPWAPATAAIRRTKPIGSSHSRLNHLCAPTRTRGETPRATGIDPDQEVSSTTLWPLVSLSR
jgi:hypothetical protein